VVSRVNVSDVVPAFPAMSVSLATIVCVPSKRPVSAKVQCPLPSAATVDAIAPPSTVKCTVAFGSPDPITVGSLVILSVGDDPVSFLRASVTTGAVLSSMNVSDAGPALPAASVSLAMTVCLPSARPVGVNTQLPLPLAVTVVAIGVPSTVKLTTAFASPDPVNVGSLVILS